MSIFKILGTTFLAGVGLEAGKIAFLGGGAYFGLGKGAKKIGKKLTLQFADGLGEALVKLAEEHPEFVAAAKAYQQEKEKQNENKT